MFDHCQECNSKNIILVEYAPDHPDHYDGISEIHCQDCQARVGRWTGKILKDGETEPPFGHRQQSDEGRSP